MILTSVQKCVMYRRVLRLDLDLVVFQNYPYMSLKATTTTVVIR